MLLGQDVSRETIVRLNIYAAVLEKWNPKINLVGKSTIADIWGRHFLDSAQIFREIHEGAGSWADFGSGGGFPGLVVAILAAEKTPELAVTLVESDQRKAAFLRTVARETGIAVQVLDARIEALEPLNVDVVSARALADLTTLVGFAARHLKSTGTALFLKGESWEKELHDAQTSWSFEVERNTSKTDSGAVVLKVWNIRNV
ncbi:16S rRNA (guanine(527)-N(7))-methyltransferase RsmG [Thalassovita taeanensis]|uniref:16S rRNA (guanine(527)-N(7))-methyltransferase RsmG n=1 Tax=Thalassovita taeanensis TaxID=657014 RepID=UPI001FEBB001|nr:16S rRNA (guanine(527)-N(7))-methyltransferase RsmG [Thalassovita taeanensis]